MFFEKDVMRLKHPPHKFHMMFKVRMPANKEVHEIHIATEVSHRIIEMGFVERFRIKHPHGAFENSRYLFLDLSEVFFGRMDIHFLKGNRENDAEKVLA
jgi:hypothetical protein